MREQLASGTWDYVFTKLDEKLQARLEKHGHGRAASPMEILGIITEEYHEVIEAIRKGENVEEELYDLAIACVFGLASHNP